MDKKSALQVAFNTMAASKVTTGTGFLTPDFRIKRSCLPEIANEEVAEYFFRVRTMAESLHNLIKSKGVVEEVHGLPLFVPEYFCGPMTWPVANDMMLALTMITHAYLHEQLGYKTVEELKKDTSRKFLPVELSQPLHQLSNITGVEPTASYCLYGLWNYRLIDECRPVSVDNVRMRFSFTDSEDEHWFVGIHNGVEATFAPAIKPLSAACILSKDNDTPTDLMVECLYEAIQPNTEVVRVLNRVREKCRMDYYFNQVRMFFSFPRNVTFLGVPEWENQEILGETGGQSPFQHFRLAILGIKHDDPYFSTMRKHMQKNFREFLEFADKSRVREFVIAKNDKNLTSVYNALIKTIVDWRDAHDALAQGYVANLGDPDGTSKAPVAWLKDLKEETKKYFI